MNNPPRALARAHTPHTPRGRISVTGQVCLRACESEKDAEETSTPAAIPPALSPAVSAIVELIGEALAGRIRTLHKTYGQTEPGFVSARRVMVLLVLPCPAYQTHPRLREVARGLSFKYEATESTAAEWAAGETVAERQASKAALLAAWEADRMQIVEWLAGVPDEV